MKPTPSVLILAGALLMGALDTAHAPSAQAASSDTRAVRKMPPDDPGPKKPKKFRKGPPDPPDPKRPSGFRSTYATLLVNADGSLVVRLSA